MSLQGKIIFGGAALTVVAFAALLLLNASLRTRVAEAEGDVAALRVGNESLKSALDKQNAALEAMREESEARARKAEATIAEGKRKADALRRGAARMAASVPASRDDCAAARALMDGYAAGRRGRER